MIKFSKGEKKNIWIEVYERNGLDFTISSATFEVLDKDGNTVQASASATVEGHKIYGLVDTTAAGFVAGEGYSAKFTFVIGSETYIEEVSFLVT